MHDLEKHEKMLCAVRSLISKLNETQERLGRRLEEILLHDMKVKHENILLNHSIGTILTEVEEIYHQLAVELYRKQEMSSQVLESTTDHLFAPETYSVEEFVDIEKLPRKVAESSSQKWSRRTAESCVQESRLQAFLNVGKREQN